MKAKLPIAALCSCLLATGLQAQTTSYGLYGGISIPRLQASNDNIYTQDFESRSAATFGVFGDFGITPVFSIKAIVSYAGEGGKRDGMQPVPAAAIPPALPVPPGVTLYGNFYNESILNYLEIPVMAKWEWGGKFRYYVNAGPYIGFLLDATQKVNGNSAFFLDKNGTQPVSPPRAFDESADVKDELNTVNVGLTGGVGIKYMFNDTHGVLLDLRGALGLSTLQKNETYGKSKTGAVFVALGYSFTLHKKTK